MESKKVSELIAICKEKGMSGYSGKKKVELIALLSMATSAATIQDTGKYRRNNKDQYYTSETVAKSCIDKVLEILPFTQEFLWVEPSAGAGAFLHTLPESVKRVGLDIDPRSNDIIKQDFLEWTPPTVPNIVTFGNPPFGKQSSLAKKFIVKSATFSNIIAFILPRSFQKPSMNNVFPSRFHCIYSNELEDNIFTVNGEPHNVPCIFQIWEKKESERDIVEKTPAEGFTYVKYPCIYDIAIRRVGVFAGKCYKRSEEGFSKQSHNFIKFEDSTVPYIDRIVQRINTHTFPTNTVGPRSLSKTEINLVINRIIREVMASL
jgi:hypothetical protein